MVRPVVQNAVMSVSAVLFDFYGTLARATRWVSADEVLGEHGYSLSAEHRAIYFADGLDGVEHDEHSQSRDHYVAWQHERTLAMLAETTNGMIEASAKLDARAVVQWCPTELKRRVNLWGAPHGDLALMQRLKSVFDPQGVLSPGRFVGGI